MSQSEMASREAAANHSCCRDLSFFAVLSPWNQLV